MLLRGKLVNELLKYILTNSFLFCQELGEIATDVAGKYGSHIDMLYLFYIHVILKCNFRVLFSFPGGRKSEKYRARNVIEFRI